MRWRRSPGRPRAGPTLSDEERDNLADLVESDNRNRRFIDRASVGMGLTTPDSLFLSVNPALARILGYDSPAEMLAAVPHARDLYVDPEARAHVFASLARDGRHEGALVWRKKDGGSAHLHSWLGGVYDDDGNLTAVEGFATDMTELRRTHDALEASEGRYRDLVELSPVGVSETTPDGRIITANASLARMFGYATPEELLASGSHSVDYLVRPDLIAASLGKLQRDGLLEEHIQCRHRDGSVLEVQLSTRGIFDEAGDLVGTQNVLVDLSALVRSYEELEAVKAKYNELLERTMTAIGRTTPSGRVVEANAAMARVLGYDSQQALLDSGVNLGELFPEQNQGAAVFQELLATGRFERVVSMRRKDGRQTDLRLSLHSVLDEDGRVIAIDGFATDVTDLKAAEQAAHRAQVEAEFSRHLAEEANHAKSEFVSRISHELRTPLSAVLGYAQLLETRDLSEADQHAVQGILGASRHLTGLINDILDLSAVEAGHVGLVLRPVPVSDAIADAVAMVAHSASDRGIRVHEAPIDAEVRVLADGQRLRQVLLNVLENAVKYNRVGGEIVIRGATSPGTVAISVSDTGLGIAEENIGRLFRPFDRTNAPPDTPGTGLGLSVSRALVVAMGGTIEARSVHGEGSTFTITLPRTTAPGAASADSTKRHGTTITNPCTILYIEDNATIAAITREIVTSHLGADLVVAPDGTTGIEAAVNQRPDVVLLDLSLPDMDGRDVLRILGRRDETHDIPIVIVSADAQTPGIKQVLAAGASGYVTKPFEVSELIAEINRALETVEAADAG